MWSGGAFQNKRGDGFLPTIAKREEYNMEIDKEMENQEGKGVTDIIRTCLS